MIGNTPITSRKKIRQVKLLVPREAVTYHQDVFPGPCLEKLTTIDAESLEFVTSISNVVVKSVADVRAYRLPPTGAQFVKRTHAGRGIQKTFKRVGPAAIDVRLTPGFGGGQWWGVGGR